MMTIELNIERSFIGRWLEEKNLLPEKRVIITMHKDKKPEISASFLIQPEMSVDINTKDVTISIVFTRNIFQDDWIHVILSGETLMLKASRDKLIADSQVIMDGERAMGVGDYINN